MPDVYHERIQRPVGEGFFHEGRVWAHDPELTNLSYIYDCGAQRSYRKQLTAQIEDSKKNHPLVDLLFLSHAHIDHVSGVPSLMSGVSVATVVMPLIEPSQRLMAFAHATVHGPIEKGVQGFYVDFTVDPAATVRELGAQRIIVVTAGNPSGSASDAGRDDVPQDEQVDEVEGVVELPSTEGAAAPQSWQLFGTGSVEVVGDEGSTVLRMPDTVYFGATAAPPSFPWVLVTHVDPPVAGRAAAFRAELQQRLGVNSQTLDKWFADPQKMKALVTTHRKVLVKSYIRACPRKDLNITSLSLFSGPSLSLRSRPARALVTSKTGGLGGVNGYSCFRTHDDALRVGWLGTGDAALKQEVRRKPFLKHFEPYAPFVHTMTLPHHGSAHSYHADLVTKIAPKICVAPAAPYSTWQHPGPSVVASALQHALVLQVSHLPASRLDEFVTIRLS